MFDLANDRLSYGELLHPEAGYTLDSAVGMTYSLDLEALLGVPVSLGMLDVGEYYRIRQGSAGKADIMQLTSRKMHFRTRRIAFTILRWYDLPD